MAAALRSACSPGIAEGRRPCLGRCVATRGVLRHRLEDDRFQIGRNRRIDPPRSARLDDSDLPQQLAAVGRIERRLQREQLVQRGAERIDVRAVVQHDTRAERLLRAHVAERAQQIAAHRQVAVAFDGGQAEIGKPQRPALINKQIRRLNISVDDAAAVSVLQRFGRLNAEPGNGAIESGAAVGAECGEGGDGSSIRASRSREPSGT